MLSKQEIERKKNKKRKEDLHSAIVAMGLHKKISWMIGGFLQVGYGS